MLLGVFRNKVTIKKIKKIGFILSTLIGALMMGVYVFSVVGLHTLIAYHTEMIDLSRLDEFFIDAWSASINRETMLSLAWVYLVFSYVLIVLAGLLKLTGFILYRLSKKEKHTAVTMITLNSINIIIKTVGLFIAIPAAVYLGYTNATLQLKFIFNILFIVTQIAIIVWAALYMTKLSRHRKSLADTATNNEDTP